MAEFMKAYVEDLEPSRLARLRVMSDLKSLARDSEDLLKAAAGVADDQSIVRVRIGGSREVVLGDILVRVAPTTQSLRTSAPAMPASPV